VYKIQLARYHSLGLPPPFFFVHSIPPHLPPPTHVRVHFPQALLEFLRYSVKVSVSVLEFRRVYLVAHSYLLLSDFCAKASLKCA